MLSLFANLNWWVFFIHGKFLVYKLETFKNCKKVKYIMIIVMIYIFLSYVIYNHIWTVENYCQKILRLQWKIHSPPKNSKSASPPFLPGLKIFQVPPPLQKGGGGGGDTVTNKIKWLYSWSYNNFVISISVSFDEFLWFMTLLVTIPRNNPMPLRGIV